MSENFRGKNVFICGYDEDNNINKLKVNKNGELKILNNNGISDSNNNLINLLQSIDNKLDNINNKEHFFGGNLIDGENLNKDQLTNMINVEKYSYCNIFYEDNTYSNYNYITIMGMLDNYSYFELDQIKLKRMHNCRKGIYIKLNIVGIKELYLQNCSNEIFEDVIASIYCY